MTETLTTSETLNKAADLIDRDGWTAGGGWDAPPGTPLCVEGAIQAVMGIEMFPQVWRCSAYRAVCDYLDLRSTQSLFGWNDNLPYNPAGDVIGGDYKIASAHAKETVIATLRAAALIEAAKETAADPLVAHLAHHAVDIIAAELDTTAAPL